MDKEWRPSFLVTGWMGYQLAQKLKLLKKKMQVWRKEVFGSIEERKNCLLADKLTIDVKEEDGMLSEDDRVNRSYTPKRSPQANFPGRD